MKNLLWIAVFALAACGVELPEEKQSDAKSEDEDVLEVERERTDVEVNVTVDVEVNSYEIHSTIYYSPKLRTFDEAVEHGCLLKKIELLLLMESGQLDELEVNELVWTSDKIDNSEQAWTVNPKTGLVHPSYVKLPKPSIFEEDCDENN